MAQSNPFDQFDGTMPQSVTVPTGTNPDAASLRAGRALDLQLKKMQIVKAQKDASKEQVGDEQVHALAVLYAANKLVPPSRPNEVAQKAIAEAMTIDPNYDPELASNRAKAIKDFSGRGSGALVVQSVNRLASHLSDMFDASEQMGGPNLGVRPLNKLVASVEQQGMPTLVAKYDAAKPFVATELEKIMKGAGQPNVSGINEAMLSLDRARSLDERRAAFKQIGALVHGALDPIKQGWNSAYGGTYAPPMWVSPKASAFFGRVDPDNADTFGGDDWRGLPGLKGVGNQPTAPPGTPPGAGSPPPAGTPPPPQDSPTLGLATGGIFDTDATHNKFNPQLTAKLDRAIRSGLPYNTAMSLFPGIKPADRATYEKAVQFAKTNPGYNKSLAEVVNSVPTTWDQRLAGSPAAALLAGSANALTAGTLDEIAAGANNLVGGTQSLEEINAKKQLLAAEHPGTDLIGNVAGGAGAMLGGGAALRGLGLISKARMAANPILAGLAGDTAYGAAYGAGENNDARGVGALAGGGAGLAGSALGTGASKVLGGALRGVVNPAVDRLRARGIPLTVGEVLGGGWKKTQDAMTSVFGPGNMVSRRYQEGREALNKAAFNEAGNLVGKPIDAVGRPAIQALEAVKSQAYDQALNPVTLDLTDPQFAGDMAAARTLAANIPNVEQAQEVALNELPYRIGNAMDPVTGQMTGRNFQEAYRGLARTAKDRSGKAYGHEVGQVMQAGKDALADTLGRQNPAALEAFQKANAVNRHLSVLNDAVNAARNQVDTGEPLFTPAQLTAMSDANTRKFSGKAASAAGYRPFNELATDAQQVMSSKLPESGTAPRRLLATALLGGIGGGAGYEVGGAEGAAVPLATLSLLGTKVGQKLLVNALIKRTARMQRGGQAIARNPQVGASILAAAGIPLLAGE